MWCIGRVHCCLIESRSLVHAPGVSEGWSVWRRNRMVHAPGWTACAFCRVHFRQYARHFYIDPLAGPAHALCTRLACADPPRHKAHLLDVCTPASLHRCPLPYHVPADHAQDAAVQRSAQQSLLDTDGCLHGVTVLQLCQFRRRCRLGRWQFGLCLLAAMTRDTLTCSRLAQATQWGTSRPC